MSRDRSRKASTCSALAIATALTFSGSGAQAQSFQGSSIPVSGTTTVSTTPTTTTITVASPQAVINWLPSDAAVGGGAIDFQPVGTTATFQNDPNAVGNFAVLNRILPTDPSRAVSFSGTVQSQLFPAPSAPGAPGGTVFFYSPGGIVLTSTARFDVGNLGLTTADPVRDANGDWYNGNTVEFGAANPGSAVTIGFGAQITASSSGSYVAAVAPRVQQQGTIDVDGSVALVAAEAATIRFDPFGLFDIEVTTGSSSGQGAGNTTLLNLGTITGPATTFSAQFNRIYMVAVPKNTAITLAIGGGSQLGFDVAGAADTVGNTVVLSAGHDISFGSINALPSAGAGSDTARIDVVDADFNSAVESRSTGTTFFSSTGGQQVDFLSSLTAAGPSVQLGAFGTGSRYAVSGDLSFTADVFGAPDGPAGEVFTAGYAGMFANTGGSLRVNGNVQLSANAHGGAGTVPGATSAGAIGGTATVVAGDNASISIGGSLDASALGTGGSTSPGVAGGSGTGGAAEIRVGAVNSSILINGDAILNANGFGTDGSGCSTCTVEGGRGQGGLASISTAAGSGNNVSIGGTVLLNAAGFGGGGSLAAAGAGEGGTAAIRASSGGAISIAGGTDIDASGIGGSHNDGGLAGDGTGGVAVVSAAALAGISLDDSLSMRSQGRGGSSFGSGGIGGTGTAGPASLEANGGLIQIAGDATVDSGGFGGDGGQEGGSGGAGRGSTGLVFAQGGGTIEIGSFVTVFGDGQGGDGATGGDGTGFEAFISAAGGEITALSALVDAGGFGGFSTDGGAGGVGTGGFASVFAGHRGFGSLEPSRLELSSATVTADGVGGFGGLSLIAGAAGGAGGDGIGGRSMVTAAAGAGTLIIDNLSASAIGIGGGGGDGKEDLEFTGIGGDGGRGGNAAGGIVIVGIESGTDSPQTDGSATFGNAVLDAGGLAGSGGEGGNGITIGAGGDGGDATGGGATLQATGGPVSADFVTLSANASGGAGGLGSAQGNGGNATVGGDLGLLVLSSNRANRTERGLIDIGTLSAVAIASGGAGAIAGSGTGGGGHLVQFRSGDGVFDDFTLAIDFDGSSSEPSLDVIDLFDATLETGSFEYVTRGAFQLNTEQATWTVGDLLIDAAQWVLGAAPATTAGTIEVTNSILTLSEDDVVSRTNFVVPFGAVFNTIGDFQTGDYTTSGDFVSVVPNGTSTHGNITAGGVLIIESSGAISTGELVAGSDLELVSGGAIATGALVAGGDLDIESAAALTIAGDALAGGSVGVRALGGVAAQDVSAEGDLGLATEGALAAGSLLAGGSVGLLGGSIAASAISAGGSVLALTGSTINLGAVSTGTAASDFLYLANASMASLGGDLDAFDPAPILAASPVAAPGNIVINGSVSTGQLVAATQQTFAALGVNAARDISVVADRAQVAGIWRSSGIYVQSDDIGIGSNGRLDGGASGLVQLISTNSSQTLIGDVASDATGVYRLDNAEFGRINSGSVEIYARDTASAVDMLIGDLTITGPLAGSTINQNDGYIEFATGQSIEDGPSGAIRIVGNVRATGFTPDNLIEINADIFEIDAASGSLSVSGGTSSSSSSTLAGIVAIEANHIHIAEGTILERLRENPLYAGREADLNRPITTTSPGEPVISALGLEFYPNATLYIQNTGTATNPAGFYTTVENSDIEPPGFENPEAEDVDVIINGRFRGESGDVVGRDAAQLVIDNAESLDGFTTTSQINGCVFSGSGCGGGGGESDPIPSISSEIALVSQAVLQEEPFAAESDEQEEEEAAARAPIAPPVPLIDTRPLNPPVDVVEAVAGGGNPALLGTGAVNQPQSGDQQ